MNLPEICTVKDIAQLLGLHVGHVRDRMVHDATFPKPIPYCERPKKWVGEDVLKWLRRSAK